MASLFRTAACREPSTNHLSNRSEILSLLQNFDQLHNGVWQGVYAEHVSVSIKDLIRHGCQLVKQHSSCEESALQFATDLIHGLLADVAAAVPPESEFRDDPVVKQEQDQVQFGRNTVDADQHHETVTKNVPIEVLYSVRGVLCRICDEHFLGAKCVKDLIHHTKQFHARKATRRFLRHIRKENSFENLIEDGIPYCTCRQCRHFGPAAFDKGLKKISLVPPASSAEDM